MILKKIKKDITYLNEQITYLLKENAEQVKINNNLLREVRILKDDVDFLKGEFLNVGDEVFVYIKPYYYGHDHNKIYRALLVQKLMDFSESLRPYTYTTFLHESKDTLIFKESDGQVLTKKQVENKFNIKIEDGVDYWEIKE